MSNERTGEKGPKKTTVSDGPPGSNSESEFSADQKAMETKLSLLSLPKFRGQLILSREQEKCPSARVMAAYLEGRLSRRERRRFHRHLNQCPTCLHVVGRTYKEEVSLRPAGPSKRPAGTLFPRIAWPVQWTPSMSAAAAGLVLLIAVGYLSLFRPGFGPTPGIPEGAAPSTWDSGRASIFLHSSYIEEGRLRGTAPGPTHPGKKITPTDLLRVDIPFADQAGHWTLLFFDERGGYLSGLRVGIPDSSGSCRAYSLDNESAYGIIEELDGMGLLEIEADVIFGASFGGVTAIGIATEESLEPEMSRILKRSTIEALHGGIAKDRDELRDLLKGTMGDTPFTISLDSIEYVQKNGEGPGAEM